MALRWFYGGYVFLIVLRPENLTLHQIWPWSSRSIATQNKRDLNQAIFHHLATFGDPSLNGLWVMMRTNSKWGKFLLFKLNLTLKVKVNTIGNSIKVFGIFGPNFAILAWTGPELLHGQASDWYTDFLSHTQRHTHRRRRWKYPKAQTDLG